MIVRAVPTGGDSDPLDGTAGTFNQLFPLAHKYLGHADVLARQNLMAGFLEASVQPTDKLKLLAWYDGEMGYVHRMMELCQKVARSLRQP